MDRIVHLKRVQGVSDDEIVDFFLPYGQVISMKRRNTSDNIEVMNMELSSKRGVRDILSRFEGKTVIINGHTVMVARFKNFKELHIEKAAAFNRLVKDNKYIEKQNRELIEELDYMSKKCEILVDCREKDKDKIRNLERGIECLRDYKKRSRETIQDAISKIDEVSKKIKTKEFLENEELKKYRAELFIANLHSELKMKKKFKRSLSH